jgi:hypothetical protein
MLGTAKSVGFIIKLILILLILGGIGYGLWYVTGLRANLAVSQENERKVTQALEAQKEAIAQMQREAEQIKEINKDLDAKIKAQEADYKTLENKFETTKSGKKRDFGGTAVKRPGLVQKAINKGSLDAMRCLEIASGGALTEAEKNATKKSKSNSICPSLANPNYTPPR